MFTVKFSDYEQGIEEICKNTLEECLRGKTYISDEAQDLTNLAVETIVNRLSNIEEYKTAYRFICAATLYQKGIAVCHISSSMVYNPNCDGSTLIQWENDYFYFIVHLYAIVN